MLKDVLASFLATGCLKGSFELPGRLILWECRLVQGKDLSLSLEEVGLDDPLEISLVDLGKAAELTPG